MPLALLEAGAMALPAVVTHVPGLSQMVEPGQTGFLAEAGNSTALANLMLHLMLMPAEERARMGHRARICVMRSYSLEAVLDQWEAIYAECRARARNLRGASSMPLHSHTAEINTPGR
jgi:glycosyltransferase involved in cell wall biosynthesis